MKMDHKKMTAIVLAILLILAAVVVVSCGKGKKGGVEPVATATPTAVVTPEATATPPPVPTAESVAPEPTPAPTAEPVAPQEPVHEHTWEPITVHHDEVGHEEVQYGERKVVKCRCGQNFYDLESFKAHGDPETNPNACTAGGSVETEKYEIGRTWVVDQAAYDEVTGYKCSSCGATK